MLEQLKIRNIDAESGRSQKLSDEEEDIGGHETQIW